MNLPPHLAQLTLTQAEVQLRWGRLSCADFVRFLEAWCVGKLEHRFRDGWMEVCHTDRAGREHWSRYQPPAPAYVGAAYDWPASVAQRHRRMAQELEDAGQDW